MVSCPQCATRCEDGHGFCSACGAALEPPREDPIIGKTLPGGYRLTHLVGVGAMGRVYCAEQVALGRTVALKVVHPYLVDDELAVGRFLNEARAASRLSHPNSVAVFDFGRTDDGRPYLVMEYLRGSDLRRVANEQGPLAPSRVVDVLRQTLAALEEAHALGIVHRDLKPDNVVLEPLRSGQDFVKVVDFGLAKIVEGDCKPAGGVLTKPGLVCGTPEYMSPEQCRGDPLDGRSDLYSVGVVLYELLAGRVPFESDSPTKTLLMHLTQPPPDPRGVAPQRSIPAPFAELTLRSLAKSPEDRVQSARAFAEALEQALLEVRRSGAEGAPASSIRCGSCGAACPSGQKFCGECGRSIAGAKAGEEAGQPAPSRGDGPAPGRVQSPARAHADPPTSEDAERVGAAPRPLPLAARADALAWLALRYHEAGAMLAAAHIVGDTGLGKTRLVAEAVARWRARGDLVVCVEPDAAWAKIADDALRRAICALVGSRDGGVDPPSYARARPDAQAGLGFLFGRDAEGPASPEERRRCLAEALRWALERGSERAGSSPIILVVDDLDFVDGTSRNAFVDVLSEPPVVSALFVATYSEGTAPAGEPLAGEACRLAPLPYEAFARWLPLGLAKEGTPLTPLHVEQLLEWSRECKEPAPERLVDLIARRADRLSPDARDALRALAVWGDDATGEVLRSLLPPSTDLGGALDTLRRSRFVTVADAKIECGHPLVRRIVLQSIPAGVKGELFARASRLRPGAPLELRAKQAMHGGGALEALSLLDALGARRASHGDLSGSVSALRHALYVARRELHHGELDDPVTAVLIFSRKLAEALAATGAWSDAEGVLSEALGTAPPASEHRAHLLGVLAQVANARRHPRDARRYLDEAMRVARQSDARGLLPILERLDKAIAVA